MERTFSFSIREATVISLIGSMIGSNCRIFLEKSRVAGLMQSIQGRFVFGIKTRNFTILTVRMNHRMVNCDEPVVIFVNGKKMFEGKVVPDSRLAEKGFQKRRTLE